MTGPTPFERELIGAEKLTNVLQLLSGPLKNVGQSGESANVWAIAGLKRNEVRNASALAALWSPSVFPQTAAPFLAEFLDRLPNWDRRFSRDELAAGYVVRTEECPMGDLGNRVDISIETSESLLMIEVKIDAPESESQVSRYNQILDRKARLLGKQSSLILLGPRPPTSGVALHANWGDISAAARNVIGERKFANQTFADHLLRQFAIHVSNFD